SCFTIAARCRLRPDCVFRACAGPSGCHSPRVDDAWLRTTRATAIDLGGDLLLLGATVRRLEGDSAELARAVLAFLARPPRRSELLAHLDAIAGPIDNPEVIAQL